MAAQAVAMSDETRDLGGRPPLSKGEKSVNVAARVPESLRDAFNSLPRGERSSVMRNALEVFVELTPEQRQAMLDPNLLKSAVLAVAGGDLPKDASVQARIMRTALDLHKALDRDILTKKWRLDGYERMLTDARTLKMSLDLMADKALVLLLGLDESHWAEFKQENPEYANRLEGAASAAANIDKIDQT